ncbi:pyridoxal phosphate-dependent decarboxylase family protein [Corynebacterium halotolerans]|uniref:pyridoxal phosphate-dependent decarboxylase family protein n=1 Tax=Corynebacterium halotolerans TaxID=225326 RepID=UPI003CEB7441
MLDTRHHDISDHTAEQLTGNLVGPDTRQLTAAVAAATELVTRYLTETDQPRSPHSRPELGFAIDAVDLDTPLEDLGATLDELRAVWLDHAVWYHHPAYIAHLNCPITVPSIAAEVLAATVNTAVESWDQATSAALIEKRLLRWTAEQIGFPTAPKETVPADGVFTSGGTQSNLQALVIARGKALARAEAAGLEHSTALPRVRFFATGNTHYSVARAAHLLGLGEEGLVQVRQDDSGRIDTVDLDHRLTAAHRQGLLPAAVIATAGTTDRGAIDPLPEIAEICHRHGVHLHVDAAYGGALLVSPARRTWLAGISGADSVTVDFHKGFFQPVACSAIVVRDGRDLHHVNWFADYLNPEHSDRLNLADVSLQTTRRFDALKLWVTLRTLGAAALGAGFDRCCDLAREAAAAVDETAQLELLDTPQLSTVLFRFVPPADMELDSGALNHAIRDRLFDTGEAIVATTVFRGDPCLKFTLLDPTMTPELIGGVLGRVTAAGERLCAADRSGVQA